MWVAMCFQANSIELFDLDGHLNFDQSIAGKRADADGGTDVSTGLAKDGDKEIGGAVDDAGRVGEARDCADVTVNADDAANEIERSEVSAKDGKLGESAALSGGIAVFDGSIFAGAARDDAGFVDRDDACKVDDLANGFG